MKKYNKPTLDCNEIAMATIMAASGENVTDLNNTTPASPKEGVNAKRVIPNHGNKFDF